MNRLAALYIVPLFCLAASAAQQLQADLTSGYYANNGSHLLLYEQAYDLAQLALPQLDSFFSNTHSNATESLEQLNTRIINGRRVRSCKQAPFMAALHYYGLFICGGSIVSPRWILSAAHCILDGARTYKVRVGSRHQRRGGQYYRVAKILIHPLFNEYTMRNDLSLLRLATSMQYGPCVQPILLPGNRRMPKCLNVFGWGSTIRNGQNTQKLLQYTTVCKTLHTACQRAYRREGIRIYPEMYCAKLPGRDSCFGDSGGPLINQKTRTLKGVVSFGLGCANEYPGVYTNVLYYKRWILYNILTK